MQVEHVERPIDNFVQVFISPHSNYWQVALASICVCISVRSEALHIAKGVACETRSEPRLHRHPWL